MDKNNIVDEITNELRKGNNVVLIAPTGWGKTVLMFRVAVALAKEGYRVGIVAPTLTLLVKKWPQLQQMLLSTQSPPRAVLTAGAGQYCVYKWNIPQRHCFRCRLYNNVVNVKLADTVVTFEDIEKMTPENQCGYWVQESQICDFDIIGGHYGRLPKIIRCINYLLLDEAHEYYLPHISSYPLRELVDLLGVPAEELSITVIKELITEKLSRFDLDPATEDKLYSLLTMLKKTCWIENDLNCLDIYDFPRGVRIFAVTATPPPGWPPEGWGRKIEIAPNIKPRAFIEPGASFYYNKQYEGATLQLYLITKWLQERFNAQRIAVFATSSLRQILQYSLPSLPPGVELFPTGG